MPVYEYRCNSCNHQFELLQKFSDPPVKECPVCGKEVHKLISQSAFSLKGDGWFDSGYCTKTDAPAPSCCQAGSCCPAMNSDN